MELSSKIKNINFPSCILNASGPLCTLEEELLLIDNSFAGGVVTKTTTLESRTGNPKPRYYDNLLGSINSMGLPNQGHNYYIKVADKISKPYIISMTGMTLEETITILTNILVSIKNFNKKIEGIEINLSCPNIVGKGQLAYDFKSLDIYIKEIVYIYIRDNGTNQKPDHSLLHTHSHSFFYFCLLLHTTHPTLKSVARLACVRAIQQLRRTRSRTRVW